MELFEKDKGIAPRQYAVFYWEKYCIGSGVIVRNMFWESKEPTNYIELNK